MTIKSVMKDKTIRTFGLIGGIYATLFFIIAFFNFFLAGNSFLSLGGSYYRELISLSGNLIFVPIRWTILLVVVVLAVIVGDGSDFDKYFLIEKVTFPLFFIVLWFLIGVLVGKIYSKLRGKNV